MIPVPELTWASGSDQAEYFGMAGMTGFDLPKHLRATGSLAFLGQLFRSDALLDAVRTALHR